MVTKSLPMVHGALCVAYNSIYLTVFKTMVHLHHWSIIENVLQLGTKLEVLKGYFQKENPTRFISKGICIHDLYTFMITHIMIEAKENRQICTTLVPD